MDPVSVASLVTGVLPIIYHITQDISKFALEASDIRDALDGFKGEVQSLGRMLEAVAALLSHAGISTQQIPAANGPSEAIGRVIQSAVDDIQVYMDKLQIRVRRIQGESKENSRYRRSIQAFAMRINRTGVNDLRSLLQTHRISLNTALLMLQVFYATNSVAQQQSDLYPQLDRLIRITEQLPTKVDLERLKDNITASHIRDMHQVAQQIVDYASDPATSSINSLEVQLLSKEAKQEIDDWIASGIPLDSAWPPDPDPGTLQAYELDRTSPFHESDLSEDKSPAQAKNRTTLTEFRHGTPRNIRFSSVRNEVSLSRIVYMRAHLKTVVGAHFETIVDYTHRMSLISYLFWVGHSRPLDDSSGYIMFISLIILHLELMQ